MGPQAVPISERFWPKVEIREADECWPWTAAKNDRGYGVVKVGPGRNAGAHRVAYELAKGPISDGLEIDHLCRNRSCVNPAHLEPVTHRENLRRGETGPGINSRKTHCIRGHEFTPANTYMRPAGKRLCRTCAREYELCRSHRRR